MRHAACAVLIAGLCIVSRVALSSEVEEEVSDQGAEEDNSLVASGWSGGPYFATAIGYSMLREVENDVSNGSVVGGNIQVSLGYWAFNALGLEIGSVITYNYSDTVTFYDYSIRNDGTLRKKRVEDIDSHVWDTSFFYGVMFRWPFFMSSDRLFLYSKVFNGYGKTIYWLENSPKESADRFYSDGPLMGIAIGNVVNAGNREKVAWFIQLAASVKFVREFVAIKDSGVLPEEIDTKKNYNNFHLLHLHLSLGCRLF